jgi:Transposase DDE domain
MYAIVHSADIQDRDGGALLMASLFGAFPFLVKLYTDGGYQGPEFQRAMKRILARVDLEIVKRLGHAKGFVVLPKRWIVERTLAWLGRCRRLAKDWECLNRKALAFLRLASIRIPISRAQFASARDIENGRLNSRFLCRPPFGLVAHRLTVFFRVTCARCLLDIQKNRPIDADRR